MSPFNHREDITAVQQPVYEHVAGKQAHDALTGAVAFRAVPGVTAEWLQRIVERHIARNNALGNDMPGTPYCPFGPKKITAKVSRECATRKSKRHFRASQPRVKTFVST